MNQMTLTTALQRQRAREEEEIEREAIGVSLSRERRVAAGRSSYQHTKVKAQTPQATQAQLAIVARHLMAIKDPNQVDRPDKPADEITKRVVSLVDMMGKDGLLSFELSQAAERYRELFLVALGPSKGVSSYGDYVPAAEPSKRLATTDRQMKAYEDLKQASVAAFGVVRQDGRWALDEQLMQLVVPAILSDKKQVTQGSIGQARSVYRGRAQVPAFGAAVVVEVLQRLSLHFQYRER